MAYDGDTDDIFTTREMSTESQNGSPASTTKRDAPGNSYLPSILPKDAPQGQYNDESSRSMMSRGDIPREPYKGTDGGMMGNAGYGSG